MKKILIVFGSLLLALLLLIALQISSVTSSAEKMMHAIGQTHQNLGGEAKRAFEVILDQTFSHDSAVTFSVQGEPQEQWKAVTASRNIRVKHLYTTTWAGSTKSLEMSAIYHVQVGVDLNKVRYEFIGNEVRVHQAEGIIISCEQIELQKLQRDEGWWNRLQDAELRAAQNTLHHLARQHAEQIGLCALAKENFIAKIQQLPQAGDLGYEFKPALPPRP